MKKFRYRRLMYGAWVCLGIALIPGSPAWARLEVSCRLPHDSFLQYEPIMALVTVRNRSSEPLVLGDPDGDASLAFSVTRAPDRSVGRTDRPLLDEPITIEPRETVSFEINLLPRYLIREQGLHSVWAQLNWRDEVYTSSRSHFDIHPGMEIGRHPFRLADESGRRRVVYLRTIHRGRHERLFLQILDEDQGICYGAFHLGSLVRLFPPAFQVDAWDRIHVLHQSAPARYTRTIITAEGVPEDHRFFSPGRGRPRLVVASDGHVEVEGLSPYQGDPVETPPRVDDRRWR